MKRRGSGEIFGVMIIGTALAIATGITVQSSTELVYGGKITVRDALDNYKGQISELIQVIDSSNNPASIKIINYGTAPITIEQVRIDSINTSYVMYEYDSQGMMQDITNYSLMPVKKLVRIDVPNQANTMQILTSNANLIDIDLP